MRLPTQREFVHSLLGLGFAGILAVGIYDTHFTSATKQSAERTRNAEQTELQTAAADSFRTSYLDSVVIDEFHSLLADPDKLAGIAKEFERVSPFRDYILEASEASGVPYTLAFANIAVESAGNVTAISHAGARGLSQLMKRTAQLEGLEVDARLDERQDPSKAIPVGINYLARWYDAPHLQLASYNAGPTRTARSISDAGGDDFKRLEPFLPDETRRHIVKVLARQYLLEHADEVDFNYAQQPLWSEQVTPVTVNTGDYFAKLARAHGSSHRELNLLNHHIIDKNQLQPGDTVYVPRN